MTPVTAYVGLGSNLADPRRQLAAAVRALAALEGCALGRVSGCYRTAAMGPAGQADYLNAAAALETRWSPLELLDRLQAIESVQGRVRTAHWGPRTLDLDLLLYGDLEYADQRLQLPHPGLAERPFVLAPLAQIAGAALEIPGRGRLDRLLAAVAARPGEGAVLERLADL